MRYVYLHGFASSPLSRKARAFAEAGRENGVTVEIPDLAEGDFAHLTISRQVAVIERQLAGDPCRLIGSSMGGYLAALYAAAHPEVDRLVLLAPAFGFSERWQELIGAGKLREWKETGSLEVFHYGDNAMRPLGYDLYEDAFSHPPFPEFPQPALLFHGVHDATVPIHLSRQFVTSHPGVRLEELDSDHELLNVLPDITRRAIPFLTAADHAILA